MEVSNYSKSAYNLFRDLQPTFIGVIIQLLSTTDIPVISVRIGCFQVLLGWLLAWWF